MTLKARILSLIIIMVLLVMASMFFTGRFIQGEIEKRFEDASVDDVYLLWQTIISNQMNIMETNISALARDKSTRYALRDNDLSTLNENIKTTYNLLSSGKIITGLAISDTNGKIIASVPAIKPINNQNHLIASSIKDSKIKRGISMLENAKPIIAVAFPLLIRGKPVGGAVYYLDFEYAMQTLKKNYHSEIVILEKNNKILFSTDSDLYKNLNIITVETNEKKINIIPYNDFIYSITTQPVLTHTDQFAAHLLTIKDFTDSYNRQTRLTWMSIAAVSIIIIIMILGMLWYINHSFIKLHTIIKIIKNIADGEITARVNVVSDDEIGELGLAFNNMAQKIQDSIEKEHNDAKELKDKVLKILTSVNQISKGDLTTEMTTFNEHDTISELSDGIQGMLDSLHTLVKQVQFSGIQVMASTTEISTFSKEQEIAITEQAASTTEVMATVTQMSATSKSLLQTMGKVRDVTESTSDSAAKGYTALTLMEEAMEHMRTSTEDISAKLAVLNEKADNINTVVTTINRVADQTNLLSLNAAIEAEKAGEHGLGFSVVAEEIRRLADQTAVATWDIEQIVKEILSAVSSSVIGMDNFSAEVNQGVKNVASVGSQLANVVGQVQALLPHFEDVTESMRTQSFGTEQIAESMEQLNEITIHTTESIKKSNQSIVRLKDAAQCMGNEVSIFKISK